MATVYYIGNAQKTAQVETASVTAVAVNGTLTATINGKTITYTVITGDTTSTAATGWNALLTASDAPPEFGEIPWTVATNVITAKAKVPGTPFQGMTDGLVFTAAGGAAVTQGHTTANSSPSDINNTKNWLRNSLNALPQAGDDIVLQNLIGVGLFWSLDTFNGVEFASVTQWRSFTGQVGLPIINPLGYREYRLTYLRIGTIVSGSSSSVPSATLTVTLGVVAGSGSSLQQYNVGAQKSIINVLSGGTVRILGTHNSNIFTVVSATVIVGMENGELSNIASATVDGGGAFNLGSGVTFVGTLTINSGLATIFCAPPTMVISNGSQITVGGRALTYTTITVSGGSVITWSSDSNITNLTLKTNSVFDKSKDARAITITNYTIDGDTCRILDPLSTITALDGTVNGQVTNGPFTFAGPRRVRINVP